MTHKNPTRAKPSPRGKQGARSANVQAATRDVSSAGKKPGNITKYRTY